MYKCRYNILVLNFSKWARMRTKANSLPLSVTRCCHNNDDSGISGSGGKHAAAAAVAALMSASSAYIAMLMSTQVVCIAAPSVFRRCDTLPLHRLALDWRIHPTRHFLCQSAIHSSCTRHSQESHWLQGLPLACMVPSRCVRLHSTSFAVQTQT